MRSTKLLLLTAVAVVAALAPGAAEAAPPPHARISGTGDATAAAGFDRWRTRQPGLQVDYTPIGSTAGKRDFANRANDFAVSDLPFLGQDPRTGQYDWDGYRPFTYAPLAATAVAVSYQLRENGVPIGNLRLSGSTLARIFSGAITDWSDPAIRADNNGRVLPARPIIPVAPASVSGTTYLLTDFLSRRFPADWTTGRSQYLPQRPGLRELTGTDAITAFVADPANDGAIGYTDHTAAFRAGLPVAKIGNAGGWFVAPDPLNVTLTLHWPLGGAAYGAPDPRLYPLSGVTYLILPTGADPDEPRMTTAKRQTIVDFFAAAVCEPPVDGVTPLSTTAVFGMFDALERLRAVDPAVDTSILDLRGHPCLNAAFQNDYFELVPMPADCDQTGNGPCGLAAGVPAEALNATPPYQGSLGLQVALGSRVALTQVDPATAGGHPAQATDPTGHRHAWVFRGELAGVSVADSRPDQPGWTVTGQATDLTNGTATVPARDAGWAPALLSAGSDAEGAPAAGPAVHPNLAAPASPGLATACLLAAAPAGSGLGTQRLSAGMEMWMPDTSPKGTYAGTLTLTLISA
ncbi:substrate-binding domain-containing protein [Dactylosporangium sp. AC04546]|uniref:substrate-binding domain-containing protein n=1 Tax=Dactylosporangium sp. AC04546 TaxID=2862460 RepID=UPI001EDCC9F3|nr:substrate-binding domain-containing protein [Dactylosporangium sp. AC04546]WVK83137.1 substrate-binding domain-containing protein [Dactylosporangium sp. AC04546]